MFQMDFEVSQLYEYCINAKTFIDKVTKEEQPIGEKNIESGTKTCQSNLSSLNIAIGFGDSPTLSITPMASGPSSAGMKTN